MGTGRKDAGTPMAGYTATHGDVTAGLCGGRRRADAVAAPPRELLNCTGWLPGGKYMGEHILLSCSRRRRQRWQMYICAYEKKLKGYEAREM